MLDGTGTQLCSETDCQDCKEIKKIEEQGYALVQEGKRLEGERLLVAVASLCYPCLTGETALSGSTVMDECIVSHGRDI